MLLYMHVHRPWEVRAVAGLLALLANIVREQLAALFRPTSVQLSAGGDPCLVGRHSGRRLLLHVSTDQHQQQDT